MITRLLKFGLLSIFFSFAINLFAQNSYAMDYSTKEVTLQNVGDEMLSEVIFEDKEFYSVSVQLNEVINDLQVDFGKGWEDVEIHNDGFGPEALLFSSPTNSVQFKRKSGSSINIKTNIFYYEPDTAPEIGGPEAFNSSNLSASSSLLARNYSVIKRSDWGADETLRYWTPEMEETYSKNSSTTKTYVDPCADMEANFTSELGIKNVVNTSPAGDELTWPLQYMKNVYKFVIHHTDSEIRDINGDARMDSRDYEAIIRAIYYYHAISRGWGDIGYNYLIDPLGNIYEGRYGGDNVIGAHALCYNNGTIGIAIIGNYQTENVPEPAQQALISLIASRAKIYRIDPKGTSNIRGDNLPNIIGHRDVRATSCPGAKLYALLPKIRERAALSLNSGAFSEGDLQPGSLDYDAQSLVDFRNVILEPNERKEIKIQFKNIGKKTWDNNTWLHVALNNDPDGRIVPVIEDKAFVAADMQERSVGPGKIGTFIVQIEGGYKPGKFTFEVAPVVNGRYKVSRSSVDIGFTVTEPDFSYQVVDKDLPSGIVFQGQKINAWVELKNTGNITWRNYGDNQITLGTSGPKDRKSLFVSQNPARIGYLLESEVLPGETGRFILDLEVPTGKSGIMVEQFIPVIERVRWLEDKALGFKVTVKQPVHLARVQKLNTVNQLNPGEMKRVELSMKNAGDLAWYPDNMQVTLLGRGIKVFKNKLVPDEPVKPGETVKFSFWVQAPYEEGRQSIFLRAKFNKIAIRGGVVRYVINVPKPNLRAQLVDQGDNYVTLRPNEEKSITVKFKNIGNVEWNKKGSNAIHLGTAKPNDRLSKFVIEDDWYNKFRPAVMNEDTVLPGETGSFTFKISNSERGIFGESFQLVLEDIGWVTGSDVRWVFKVSGDPVKSSSKSNSDADLNKKKAEAALQNKVSTTTTKTTTTKSVVPTASADTQEITQQVTERPFRVRLSYSDANSEITSNKDFKVLDSNNNELFSVSSGNKISLRQMSNNIHAQLGSVVKSDDVLRFVPEADGIMEISTWENRPAWNKELNDNQFRGIVEARVINNQVAYINELPLEDYIKGLGEVSNDSPLEKQKTIAVLARTYASFYMLEENRKFPGMPYDGSDDPEIFQKYLGYGMEKRSPNFVGAAALTKNEIVTYNGKLVKTPYFNQSEGRTLSAEEVWGWKDTPYLKSVPDPWCVGRVKRGHGVGLSGFGATAQANEGKNYIEIIKYYFTGVEVEKLK
ncbi:N-acetylmuramoyl-L-alanine amidase [Candidatus Peregrinibacteria bacterium]|nr:N-acetylmuramoyl-L-alanine amidase [Candidatus Peregrinibacteria bacterium]